jgi:hypothetical protein
MKKVSRWSSKLFIFTTFVGLVLGFQNCSLVDFAGRSSSSGGNGESYTGKPTYYDYKNASQPCSQTSRTGQPFPNRQIFLQNGVFTLVRDACADVTPRALAAGEFTFDFVTDTLVYQGQTFNPRADLTDFNVVPLICPVGRTVNNTNPPNIYQQPLELSSAPWMNTHPQIPAALDGSIEALPRFRVEVTSTNPADWFDWMRVGQQPLVVPSTEYAVSFLLQPRTLNRAVLYYDENNGSYIAFGVDLIAQTVTMNAYQGVTNPSYDLRRYGQSLLLTVFFRSSGGAVQGDTGIAPWRGNHMDQSVVRGDSIFAAAAAFRTVSSYCGP